MTVLVVGEALVDVVAREGGEVEHRPGGSPANVAVGLRRLGHDVTLLTCLGDDAPGRLLTRHLEGVELIVTPVARTSTAEAVLDGQGRAAYAFDFAWEGSGEPVPAAGWLHVGSLSATAGEDVLALVEQRRGRCRTSYDPNLRPQLMSRLDRSRARALVALVDVVKLSDDDAELLVPGADPETAARSLLDGGPELVVMTLGAQGCLAVRRDEPGVLRLPATAGGPVVDTIGAGDAFTAGLVDALSRGEGVEAALRRASAVARLVCERPGADPPWRDELAGV